MIVNFVVELYVDCSIENLIFFYDINVIGMVILLELVKKYLYIKFV